jgi:hypothetical protein
MKAKQCSVEAKLLHGPILELPPEPADRERGGGQLRREKVGLLQGVGLRLHAHPAGAGLLHGRTVL